MSLLPKALQFRDEALSLPLGEARKPVAPPKWDSVWLFENGDHPAGTIDDYTPIDEADCRQVKGAKKPASIKDLEQAVFEDWLARTCPSGDVEQVQRLWEESTEYEEFCAEHNPAPPSTEKPPKFKPGDRVRPTYSWATWKEAVLTRVENGRNWAVYGEGTEETNCHDNSIELVSPSEPKEADGWIAHRPGDPCPVEPEVIVHCKNSTGHPSPCAPTPARTWAWGYVTAFRLVKQQ